VNGRVRMGGQDAWASGAQCITVRADASQYEGADASQYEGADASQYEELMH
jgi:hypothetical protein